MSPAEQTERAQAYVDAIRRRGFDLGRAPHTHLALCRRGAEGYLFIWAFDYTLQDGWSFPLILGDFFTLYAVFCRRQDAALEQRRPFRDHIEWLQRQDLASAEAYWRKTLTGFTAPTPLVRRAGWKLRMGEGLDSASRMLSVAATTALQSFARRHQLTLNTLVQGAWAVLLSGYSGQADVVFGTIVSGRPAALAGVEAMVGMFNNLLPVRIQVAREQSLLSWLRELQSRQVELREYEYSPLACIKEWCDLPEHMLLFESYLVFENFPVAASFQEQAKTAGLRNLNTLAQTEHPLRVEIVPGPSLWLIMSYYRGCFDATAISDLLDRFQTLLEALVSNPDQSLGALFL